MIEFVKINVVSKDGKSFIFTRKLTDAKARLSQINEKTGPSLDWCIVRLGKDENWWVESISDKENWDIDDLGIIDPKQFLHISELLDSMTEFGLDSQFVDEAFYIEISEELKEAR